MVNTWCMRMEAKNSYFKRIGQIGNFKNLPLSIARRHQKLLCAYLQGPFFDFDEVESGPCKYRLCCRLIGQLENLIPCILMIWRALSLEPHGVATAVFKWYLYVGTAVLGDAYSINSYFNPLWTLQPGLNASVSVFYYYTVGTE